MPSVTLKYGCANTKMNALMWAWMSQKTRTTPALSKRTTFDLPVA